LLFLTSIRTMALKTLIKLRLTSELVKYFHQILNGLIDNASI
jgi:hypothetical protein